MPWHQDPSNEDLRALLAEMERELANSEEMRGFADRQLREKPIYPDRPHWQHDSNSDHDGTVS